MKIDNNNQKENDIYQIVQEKTNLSQKEVKHIIENTLGKSFSIDALIKFIEQKFGIILSKSKEKKYHLSKLPQNLLKYENDILAQSSWILKGTNITKQIENKILFENVNLQIDAKEKSIFIGENGTGKSSLLKVLAGKDDDFEGKIEYGKNMDCMLIDQHLLESNATLNLKETYYSALGKKGNTIRMNAHFEKQLEESILDEKEMEDYLDIVNQMTESNLYYTESIIPEVLMYFGFDQKELERSYAELSGGEKMRFLFAAAVIRSPDLLILDEPTNYLDIEGIMWLENLLQRWQKSILCVSHDKSFIDSTFNSVVVVDKGTIKKYKTTYSNYLILKEKEDIEYSNSREKILEQKKELELYISQNKLNALRTAIVDKKKKELEQMHIPEKLSKKGLDSLTFESEPFHTNIIQANNISFGYANTALGNIDTLVIDKKTRIGIMGANGSGKTTLLKTLLQEIPALSGEVTIHSSAKIGYLSQFISLQDSINPTLNDLALDATGKNALELVGLLKRINIKSLDLSRKWNTFSGGEQVKIALLLTLVQKPHLLVLDEPTNHLDLFSKEDLASLLHEYDGAIIIASHDRQFISDLVDETYFINEGIIKKMEISKAISILENLWTD